MTAPTSDEILVVRSDRLAVVTFDRPRRRNAVTLAMWRRLAALFGDFAGEDEVRAVILTGAGGHFSAGADIAEFATLRDTAAATQAYDDAVDQSLAAIVTLAKPVIAAIAGSCMGGGLGLALACDFRIAAENAVFAVPAARLGIVYGLAETRSLLAQVGLAGAKRILFSGERIGAAEALRIGLVEKVVEDELAAARDLAAGLAENAPLSIAGAKTILAGLALGGGHFDPERARALAEAAALSEDYREGRRAFLEKRPPVFKGR